MEELVISKYLMQRNYFIAGFISIAISENHLTALIVKLLSEYRVINKIVTLRCTCVEKYAQLKKYIIFINFEFRYKWVEVKSSLFLR